MNDLNMETGRWVVIDARPASPRMILFFLVLTQRLEPFFFFFFMQICLGSEIQILVLWTWSNVEEIMVSFDNKLGLMVLILPS